ncbi:hypothetical protein NPIL_462641, partial [Nephila pilipes]
TEILRSAFPEQFNNSEINVSPTDVLRSVFPEQFNNYE